MQLFENKLHFYGVVVAVGKFCVYSLADYNLHIRAGYYSVNRKNEFCAVAFERSICISAGGHIFTRVSREFFRQKGGFKGGRPVELTLGPLKVF